MRRLFVILSLALILVSPYAASQVSAQCGTPVPTWTPTPTYQDIVLGTQSANLIAYFPLTETSGTNADDLSGVSADGTYSGVTLNATTFLNGDPAPSFDGVNDYVNIYSTALNTVFNPAEGSVLIWIQVANASVWTDTLERYAVTIANASSNRARMFKMGLDGRFNNNFVGSNTSRQIQKTGLSDANWHQFILTWSASSDTVTAYYDGGLINSLAYATFTGALSSTGVTIGANGTSGSTPWYGYIAHVAVWSKQLDSTDATALYNVPSPGSPTPTVQPTCTSTPTPTPTDTPVLTWTPTPSITPTADLLHYLTVIPPGGTEDDAQIAALRYEASAGEIMVTIPLMILVVLAVMRQVLRMRGR